MSSQDNQGIPLHYAPDGVGYKLLEIPPELQALLESNEPPTLRIESSPAAALLKTADKTWSLRQKNTSNALIILKPSTASQASAEISQPGINAIATVHETIELVPESSDSAPVPAPKGKWHERFGRSR